MTEYKKNIWFLLIIIIGGVIFFYLGKRNYDAKLTQLKEKAKEALIEALNQELKLRNVEGRLLYSDPKKSLKFNTLTETAIIEYGLGKREYKLDPMKHYLNMTSNTNLSALHRYVFEHDLIVPDTINAEWKLHLMGKNIQNTLRVSVTDKEDKTISNLTSDCQWYNDSKAVFENYIRYHCEIEIVRFLNYSIWRLIELSGFMYFVLYIAFIWGSMKTVFIINEKVNPTPKIETKQTSIQSYCLKDDIIFHAGQKRISINGEEKKMTPQVCLLLKLFLNAPNYALTDDEIFSRLWPDKSGTPERLHQVITRLRRLLSDSSICIERHGNSSYQLIK